MRCLDAIRDTLPEGLDAEVLVLDNASGDGSVEAVREWNSGPSGLGDRLRLIALERRLGKAQNDSTLLEEARGEWCLLLNEDSELCPGAIEALMGAVGSEPKVAAAGAQLLARGRLAFRVRVAAARPSEPHSSRPCSSTSSRDPERQGPGGAQRRLGAVGRDARPAGGRGRGRLSRPGVLRLLGRNRLPKAAPRRRVEGALRPRRAGDPPRAADERPRRGTAAPRRVSPQPGPLHAKASRAGERGGRTRPDRLDLRGPGLGLTRHPRPRRRLVLATRPPGAQSEGRGNPRGGRRAERAPRPRAGGSARERPDLGGARLLGARAPDAEGRGNAL